MKRFTKVQQLIISQLSDGQCHSGNAMGQRLGMSRTAVWKHITQLIDLGLPIKRLAQQGYQLARPFQPLDEQKITSIYQQTCDLFVFSEVNSTNQFLKELTTTKPLVVCCSESQSQGRGRFGRQWISPFGENIYLSYRRQIDCCLSELSGLSLVISLAVHECLSLFVDNQNIQIKWPNDLLWQHKKLCGVLIEMIAEGNGSTQIIIGIGLNVNTATQDIFLEDKPWCSLHEISGQYFDRNEIIGTLLNYLTDYLNEFFNQGFRAFLPRWQRVDYLYGKAVQVQQSRQRLQGVASGIDSSGHLLLSSDGGVIQALSSGDTSLADFVPD